MLAFSAQVKILEKYEDERLEIGKYVYDVYLVKAGDLTIKALFESRYQLEVGDCVRSEQVYLTNYDRLKFTNELAIRFGKFEVFPSEEFVDTDRFEVKCNGKFIKSDKTKIKFVGATKKPFAACTISIKNEDGKQFNVLLVGLYRKADMLLDFDANTYINLTARLSRKIYEEGFELNAISAEIS